jgi:hypothetical protein
MSLASAYLQAQQQTIQANQAQRELAVRQVQMAQQAAQQKQAFEAAQKVQAQNAALEKQRLEVQQSMEQQRINLQRQQMQQQIAIQQKAASDAAEVISQRRGYYQALSQGVDPMKANYMFPKAVTPAQVDAQMREKGVAKRSAEISAEKRAQFMQVEGDKYNAAMDKRHAEDRKEYDKMNKPKAVPKVTLKLPNSEGSISLPANDPKINEILGDDAPKGLGTNYGATETSGAAKDDGKPKKKYKWDPDKGAAVPVIE